MPLTLFDNTYLTLSELDDYVFRTSGNWDELDVEQRESYLAEAAALLDNHFVFMGEAVSATQSMAWPRTELKFFDPIVQLEVPVPEGEVPVRLKKAQAQLALHLFENKDAFDRSRVEYESISVGPISLRDSDSSRSRPTSKLPMEVRRLVSPLADRAMDRTWWRAN